MNLYIDESGSINNKLRDKPFVISIIYVQDFKKLSQIFKRFVSSNFNELKRLDSESNEKSSGKMFINGKFRELKGSQFSPELKKKFVEFFTKQKYFELFYIKIDNSELTDKICENTARAFNFSLKLALSTFFEKKIIPNEDCLIQLDERNERTDAKNFLENYLNTEFCLNGISEKHFVAKYLDSANCPFIQIADIFANLYYSQLNTNAYSDEIKKLDERNILKYIFEFPNRKIDEK